MSHDIDVGFGFMDLEIPDTDVAEVSDAVEQFFQDARLDAAMGKAGTAVTLRAETSGIDRRAADIFKAERRAPNSAAPARSESDELLIGDSSVLAKMYMGVRPSKPAHRIEKSANGLWTLEYDEAGELIAGHALDADEVA